MIFQRKLEFSDNCQINYEFLKQQKQQKLWPINQILEMYIKIYRNDIQSFITF